MFKDFVMKNRLSAKKALFSLLFITAINFVNAETFRVHAVNEVKLNSSGSAAKTEAGVNDAVVIILPEDMTFIQGIEISFKVPQVVSEWSDSVAWSFYEEISPSPSAKKTDYSGIRSNIGTFNSTTLNLQIPLTKAALKDIKQNPYAKLLDIIPQVKDSKIFLRMQIAMKGVPENIGDKNFELSVRPIFIDKGRLIIKPVSPENTELKPYSAFIDGQPVSAVETGNIINTGIHTVNIVSDYYRNEVRTITLEQAQNLTLNIQLRDIAPTLLITAPSATEIYFDGNKIETDKLTVIEQGEHEIKFLTGDYETVKRFTAVNGRSYNISLNLEADISEED